MSRRLTEAEQISYLRDGFVFPLSALSLHEADRYRTACDYLEDQLGGKPRTIEVRQMHLHFSWAWDLATHPAVLDAVEDLLGPDLLIWATELFAKHPQDANVSIGWHRDRPYLGLCGGRTTTAWIALSDSKPANGCMRGLPRSAEDPDQSARSTLPADAENSLVDVVLRPGEFSLHDADVLHGSRPNLSTEKRVGFVVRFITPDARPVHGKPTVVLARGADRAGHFATAERPTPVPAAQALTSMRESAGLHLDTVLRNLKHAPR